MESQSLGLVKVSVERNYGIPTRLYRPDAKIGPASRLLGLSWSDSKDKSIVK